MSWYSARRWADWNATIERSCSRVAGVDEDAAATQRGAGADRRPVAGPVVRLTQGSAAVTSSDVDAAAGADVHASPVRQRTQSNESKNTSLAHVGQCRRFTRAVWPRRAGATTPLAGADRESRPCATPVRYDDGPVRIVTIDGPSGATPSTPPPRATLLDAFEAFDADEAVGRHPHRYRRGVLRRGRPEGARRGRPASRRRRRPGPMGPTRLRLGKPVIAAIEGPAVAGGLELALWCDLRVAARDAMLGVYCRRFGVPLVDLGTVRLPRLIGHSRAIDLILTGRGVDGTEAERIGLVNRVVAPGTALDAAVALAHEFAALPQRCMRNDRRSAIEQWDLSEDEATGTRRFSAATPSPAARRGAGAGRFAAGAGRHGARRDVTGCETPGHDRLPSVVDARRRAGGRPSGPAGTFHRVVPVAVALTVVLVARTDTRASGRPSSCTARA